MLSQVTEPKYGHNPALTFTGSPEFFEYLKLQQYSKGHHSHLVQYFEKHLQGKTFSTPQDLQKYVQTHKGQRDITKAARNYLTYCEKYERLSPEVIQRYRKFLKIPQGRVDVYVPSTEEILAAHKQIAGHPGLKLIFEVLMCSGIRYIEALELLRSYDPSRFIVHEKYVVYTLSRSRRTKTVNNVYLPRSVYAQMQHLNYTYQGLRVRLRAKGCKLSFKYLRKWNYNFMLYAGVPESVADFMQGRSSKSVAANHYLAKSQQAAFWYEKVSSQLQALLDGAENH